MALTYCHYQGSANANYTLSQILWGPFTHFTFSPDGPNSSTQHRGFSLPYATGGPRHDGQLTCNYCDQTTQANQSVITAIIQIGKTPTPHRLYPRGPKEKGI